MIITYFTSLWHLLLQLSPWLLLGMLIAGILHIMLPVGFIQRHFGRRRFLSVLKAVAVGVPMPLCSCGVIPTAIGLKKDGASDGAATGFLISTPQTGIDSIVVSAAFLGWPFALFKVVSALISGLIGGLLVNLFHKDNTPPAPDNCPHCRTVSSSNSSRSSSPPSRSLREALHFAFISLLRDIYRWLILGLLLAALISTLIPPGSLAEIRWTQGLPGMFAVLLISLPMYICATASVPLAASLVVAGMSPGAALVLLMAGPVTNITTVGTIYRSFGKTVIVIYLATVATLSIVLGLLFNWVLLAPSPTQLHSHPESNPFSLAATLVLITLLTYFSLSDLYKRFHPVAPNSVSGTHEKS